MVEVMKVTFWRQDWIKLAASKSYVISPAEETEKHIILACFGYY